MVPCPPIYTSKYTSNRAGAPELAAYAIQATSALTASRPVEIELGGGDVMAKVRVFVSGWQHRRDGST